MVGRTGLSDGSRSGGMIGSITGLGSGSGAGSPGNGSPGNGSGGSSVGGTVAIGSGSFIGVPAILTQRRRPPTRHAAGSSTTGSGSGAATGAGAGGAGRNMFISVAANPSNAPPAPP